MQSPRLLGAWLALSVVTFDPWGFAPFGPLKWTVTAVGLGLSATVIVARGRSLVLDRRTTIAGAALLGWLFVATVGAIDPLHAWIGTPDRRLGWLAVLGFAVAFACGQTVTADRDLRLIARGAALGVLGAGAYAVLELLDAGPVDIAFAGSRTGGTYGQPAYLGAACALLVPVALGLAFDRAESRWWRTVAGVGATFGGIALGASQARAAWVGVAVAVLLVASRGVQAARRRPRVAAGLGAALVLVALVTPVGGRAESIFTGDGTARGRVDEWRVAARALADRPVLGPGPEGYRIVFPAVVDTDYARRYGREVVTDRAHNGALDVGVAGGLPALAAYVVLMGFVLAAAWRLTRAPTALDAGLGVGVVAYVVQQQFLFPLSEVDPVFWLLAGIVVARAATVDSTQRVRVPRVAAVLVAAVTAVALAAGALEVASDRALESSTLASTDRATRLRPDSIRNWFVAARVAERGGTIAAVDDALDRIEAALDRSPRDPILRAERARLLLERARRSGRDEDLVTATRVLEQLVADDPNHAELRLQLGVAYAEAGDLPAAEGELRRAADLAPGNPAPLANLDEVLRRTRGDQG